MSHTSHTSLSCHSFSFSLRTGDPNTCRSLYVDLHDRLSVMLCRFESCGAVLGIYSGSMRPPIESTLWGPRYRS